jgi:threonine synthase
VLSLAVHGSFDDCQALVKAAMANPDLNARHRFSSANSINIGRLLPQCIYYAHASLVRYRASGQKPSFIVPTGNLGNGLALMLCKQMGLPVSEVILATNENRVIGDYLEGGEWLPTESKTTLASAMDVGNPSNMERLLALFGDAGSLHRLVRAVSVSDQQIEEAIREGNSEFGFAICPHTATACHVYGHLSDEERRMKDWIVVATAHPAKFEQVVEPLTGQVLVLPDSLRAILDRPSRSVAISPDLPAFVTALEEGFGLDARSSAGDK